MIEKLTKEEIQQKVYDVIVDVLQIKPEEISPEKSLVEDLGADSLDAADLTMSLEENFGFEIPEKDVDSLKTVQNILDFIEKQIHSQQESGAS